jgi:hypothetical protein
MTTKQSRKTVGLFIAEGCVFGEDLNAVGNSHGEAMANFVKKAALVVGALPPMLRKQAQ